MILELGLFTGRLGWSYTFILAPKASGTHLPSDLLGVIVGRYDAVDNSAGRRPSLVALKNAVRGAATDARLKMEATGARPRMQTATSLGAAGATGSALPGVTVDPWRAAAEAGVLQPLTRAHIRIGTPVVDDLRGAGRIIEIGPESRFVVVEFPDGSKAQLQVHELREQRFVQAPPALHQGG